jgi:hypothetical protein
VVDVSGDTVIIVASNIIVAFTDHTIFTDAGAKLPTKRAAYAQHVFNQ